MVLGHSYVEIDRRVHHIYIYIYIYIYISKRPDELVVGTFLFGIFFFFHFPSHNCISATVWQYHMYLENELDGNCTRMLHAVLNKSWKQHPTKKQLYGYLHSITQTICVRWTKHAGLCWRSEYELISDIFLWTPTHRHTSVGWSTKTYIDQLCEDSRYIYTYTHILIHIHIYSYIYTYRWFIPVNSLS